MHTFYHLAQVYIVNGWDFIALGGLLIFKMVWLFSTLACLGSVFFLTCFRETPYGVQAKVSMLCSRFSLVAVGATALEMVFYFLYSSGVLVGLESVSGAIEAVFTPNILVKDSLRLGGLLFLVVVGYRAKSVSNVWGAFGTLLILVSFGMSDRINWFDTPWLATLVMTHVTFASFWMGSLWCILQLIDTPDFKQSFEILSRFNAVAVHLLPVMILAGLLLAWQIVGTWSTLFTTTYGITLLCKFTFFLCCFGLGLLNKVYHTPGLGGSKKEAYKAVHNLQIYVRLEIVFIGLIFFCTAILAVISPQAS